MTTALTRRHSESIALVALFAALLGVASLKIPRRWQLGYKTR